jgi:deferrochelatase/peroxidase EfeB
VNVNRRGFIKGLTASAAGAAVNTGLLGADAYHAAPRRAAASAAFHGAHQAGIFTPAQPSAAFAAFDVTAGNAAELREVFRTLTARARFLTAGGAPADLGADVPPADSGVLGTLVHPDGLTITVSAGATLFDDRFGLAGSRPTRLAPMPVFPNDALEPTWCHGDLLLQICAGNTDTVHHALRDITRQARGGIQLRYRVNGFISPPRPAGAPRNLMGFKDGTANPTVADGPDLVWAGAATGEPAWAEGGTYQVVRLIRMLTEFWDRVSLKEQETIIGRRRDSGAPLDGTAELDTPDYARDPAGALIPLNAHIRLANPRTPEAHASRILRRGYNYDSGVTPDGNLDAGLIFCCYQQDVHRQFEAAQARLAEDPLNDYVLPFGGGYFYALPGVTGPDDWYGRALLRRA